jgi:hypothetical protein
MIKEFWGRAGIQRREWAAGASRSCEIRVGPMAVRCISEERGAAVEVLDEAFKN